MINFDDYLFRNNQKVKVGQSGLMDPYVVRRHICLIEIAWIFYFLKEEITTFRSKYVNHDVG